MNPAELHDLIADQINGSLDPHKQIEVHIERDLERLYLLDRAAVDSVSGRLILIVREVA